MSDALASKSRAICCIQEQILSIDDHDVEILLAGILILAVTSMDDTLQRSRGFALQPFMPWCHWHNVYGKIPIVEAHFRAVCQLVERVGGLEKVKFKGVAALIAQ